MRKAFWRKGGGELLSFVVCLPILLFLFSSIVSGIQIGMAKQALEYAAYAAGRAAVVTDTLTGAQIRAQLVAEKIVYDSAGGIIQDSVQTDISVMDNRSWGKGNFIRCTVSAEIRTAAPFISGKKNGTIVMMIERNKVTGAGSP